MKIITAISMFLTFSFSILQGNNKTELSQIINQEIWNITGLYGGEPDVGIHSEKENFITSSNRGLKIVSKKIIPANSQIELVIRFNSDKQTSITIDPCLKVQDETGENPCRLSLTMYPDKNQPYILWSFPTGPGEKHPLYGSYLTRTFVSNKLQWPEMVKKRFEMDLASIEPVTKKWISIRYVIKPSSVQVWIDDRLLREKTDGDFIKEGFFRITCYQGIDINSLKLNSFKDYGKFVPVPIDGYTNTSFFPGKDKVEKIIAQIQKNEITVAGIPFLLSGNFLAEGKHLDIGKSWARFGLLEGAFDGWEGETPRWRGALHIEPGRLCFRIPNAPYTKIHFLAAADDIPNTVPEITVIFYRPDAGHPVCFRTIVPVFNKISKSEHGIPFITKNGEKGNLYLVTLPLLKEGLKAFSDLECLEFELTKKVRVYRSFPDPIYYSIHQAGLPSSVHIFAITFEKPDVLVDFVPSNFAHIWTFPEKIEYFCNLTNTSKKTKKVQISISTESYDGKEKTRQIKEILLSKHQSIIVPFTLNLKKYGYHKTVFTMIDSGETRVFTGSLAYLHPDTRERGNWSEGKGQIFGFWDWNGAHVTPSGVPRLEVMVKAGVESAMHPFYEDSCPETELEFLRRYRMKSYFLAYQLHMTKEFLGVEWDPSKPEEMKKAVIQAIEKSPLSKPTSVNTPELAVFFAEPLLGPVSYISLPEFYGDPPYQMTPSEQTAYEKYHQQFVIAGSAIKQRWPDAKCLFPWGIPSFPIPFLRYSKEATELMDGPALDIVLFERIPEMQMHQVTFACVMWQLKQEWLKTGKKWPELMAIEGPSVSPSIPGALTPQEEADHTVRAYLILMAYNTTRHFGCPAAFQCAGSWGETHYGNGLCQRIPLLYPKPVYCAYATLTRHTNRMKYIKMVPTGSNTVFCFQFAHYKSGKKLHVLWTIRGTRRIFIESSEPKEIFVYDQMDNLTRIKKKNGKFTINIGTSPCYIWGIENDPVIILSESDHSDAYPSRHSIKISNLGSSTWKISNERDLDYEKAHSEFVKKFPGKMSCRIETVPDKYGKKALAITLLKQDIERKTMPFYTTIIPDKPIPIPGKPSHLGLWVKANSDWGRIVYCIKDAKGEKWLSNGKNGEWNVDDVHCNSVFCFDGWRYLRFELPGNQPYDCYREPGTCWWGNYNGDGIVDLPITLEKIFVERRTHVIVADELKPADINDTLLGDLFAEYENPLDETTQAIRLSQLRMDATEQDVMSGLKK
ncbi:MAG: hypothetical protein NC906_06270 [Candidatus Omnitrophica bacterium]|nr:hypothetical protein [Candidatus Omnitrophota bacterium]